MANIWYRGEAQGVLPSRPGGNIHDFGDGVYFASSPKVALQYAAIRANQNTLLMRVYEVSIDRATLGNVIDLTGKWKPEWEKFLASRPAVRFLDSGQVIEATSGPTWRQLLPPIKMAFNENYYPAFQEFLKRQGIEITQYHSVIGPELVRGGNQLCLLAGPRTQIQMDSLRLRHSVLVYSEGEWLKDVPERKSVPLPARLIQRILPRRSREGN